VLLINDGSTDNSGNICDDYANRDKRIKVFHKENGGLSSALNFGLKSFTGDYLGFVDSDDWIEPDMYEVLYYAVKKHSVPISVCGYFKSTDIESVPMKNEVEISEDIISTVDMLLYPLKRDNYMAFCGYVWNKLYSADVIRNGGLLFDENIRYGMDVIYFAQVVINSKCEGTYIDKPLYHYYQRDTAISKTKSVDVKTDILDAYKGIEKLLYRNGYSDISYWARGFYCYHVCVAAEMALANNDMEMFNKLQNEIKDHLPDYIKTNKQHPEKHKRMYELLKIDND